MTQIQVVALATTNLLFLVASQAPASSIHPTPETRRSVQ